MRSVHWCFVQQLACALTGLPALRALGTSSLQNPPFTPPLAPPAPRSAAMRCHYEVLAVERDSDGDTIRKAYRKLALVRPPLSQTCRSLAPALAARALSHALRTPAPGVAPGQEPHARGGGAL